MMDLAPNFTVRLAKNTADLHAVQRLRYDVFVRELGASGAGIDHDRRLEQDAVEFRGPFHCVVCERRRDIKTPRRADLA